MDNLKSNWKKAGAEINTPDELQMLRLIKNQKGMNRIRLKLITETILLIGFSVIYYDVFDGADKPLWVNLLLIGSALAYIFVRFAGWMVLRNPVKGENLVISLRALKSTLQQMALGVLVTSFLFGSALILFFATSIHFTNEKYVLLTGMILTLNAFIYLNSRIWFMRVKNITNALSDFTAEAEK